jgi:hypothetical protein
MLPWSPQLDLRYAHFSGDPNPNDRLKQSYDPLFTTGGSRGFGSWFLGEIFGQYISANTNLNLAMVHLKISPLDTLDTGILYYNFRFDQPAQFDNPLITAKNAAQELDFYSVWSETEWLTLTGVVAFATPGTGLKQAAQAFVIDNGPELAPDTQPGLKLAAAAVEKMQSAKDARCQTFRIGYADLHLYGSTEAGIVRMRMAEIKGSAATLLAMENRAPKPGICVHIPSMTVPWHRLRLRGQPRGIRVRVATGRSNGRAWLPRFA